MLSEQFDALRPIASDVHRTSGSLAHLPEHAPNHFLIVDDQNGGRTLPLPNDTCSGVECFGWPLAAREEDLNRRAFSGSAIDPNRTPMSTYDPLRRRESQTSTSELRREEWVEHLGEGFLVHPAPCVGNLHEDVRPF